MNFHCPHGGPACGTCKLAGHCIQEPENVYEVRLNPHGSWSKVTWHIFRSWTGERRYNGAPFTGPVYYLGTDRVSRP